MNKQQGILPALATWNGKEAIGTANADWGSSHRYASPHLPNPPFPKPIYISPSFTKAQFTITSILNNYDTKLPQKNEHTFRSPLILTAPHFRNLLIPRLLTNFTVISCILVSWSHNKSTLGDLFKDLITFLLFL